MINLSDHTPYDDHMPTITKADDNGTRCTSSSVQSPRTTPVTPVCDLLTYGRHSAERQVRLLHAAPPPVGGENCFFGGQAAVGVRAAELADRVTHDAVRLDAQHVQHAHERHLASKRRRHGGRSAAVVRTRRRRANLNNGTSSADR